MCGRYVITNPVSKTKKIVKTAIKVQDKENYNAPNLKRLLTNKNINKIFHFARADLLFIKKYLEINVENINCYSNEGNIWNKSKISFTSKSELSIKLNQKFKSERGRINCSLRENDGRWRWLGIQYVIAEY